MADEWSRQSDCDDWGIQSWVFHKLGCPGRAGIDAFKFSWRSEFCWWVPPPHLITKVIRKIETETARGVLIIPEWKSSAFWPKIEQDFASVYFKENILKRP